jgi:hypothetical protein
MDIYLENNICTLIPNSRIGAFGNKIRYICAPEKVK